MTNRLASNTQDSRFSRSQCDSRDDASIRTVGMLMHCARTGFFGHVDDGFDFESGERLQQHVDQRVGQHSIQRF